MDLIIGGAYQGKCTFAAEKYDLAAEDICDLAVSAPVPARCYVHLEALTRQEAPEAALPLLLAAEVVVAREIGSGVVPIDAGERAWRERHGRLLRQLAESAGHVYRVFCGLTEELKATDPLLWTSRMNNILHSAEEIVLSEMVYN